MALPDSQRRHGRFLWGPLRARLGLSLRDLSELSGVNRGDLSKAESGSGVSARAFEKVLAAIVPLMGSADPGDAQRRESGAAGDE